MFVDGDGTGVFGFEFKIVLVLKESSFLELELESFIDCKLFTDSRLGSGCGSFELDNEEFEDEVEDEIDKDDEDGWVVVFADDERIVFCRLVPFSII